MIWEKLIDCKEEIISIFDEKAQEFNEQDLIILTLMTVAGLIVCGVMTVSVGRILMS